jgi:hypothetical protein
MRKITTITTKITTAHATIVITGSPWFGKNISDMVNCVGEGLEVKRGVGVPSAVGMPVKEPVGVISDAVFADEKPKPPAIVRDAFTDVFVVRNFPATAK